MDESNGQLTAILIKVWGPSSSSRSGPTSAGEIDGGKWESVHYRPLLFRNLSTCKGQTCVERDPLATFGLLALAFSVHEEARGTRQESAARGSAMSSIHVIRTSVDVSSCPALFSHFAWAGEAKPDSIPSNQILKEIRILWPPLEPLLPYSAAPTFSLCS